MKRLAWILCLMMMISFFSGAAAAQPEFAFVSASVEINVGRRVDIGSMLNAVPEEDVTEITYLVSDETVGEIIDGKFVTKRVGSIIITAWAVFDVDGEIIMAYDTLRVHVNADGPAVKSYDTNMDGIINSADLSNVLSAYGSSDDVCDFDEDGSVNSSDLSLILSRYGSSL